MGVAGKFAGSALAAALVLGAALPSPRAAEFFVSPRGDDANAGSREKPFATLARARDAVRKLGAGRGPATVFLLGGTHYLAETFTLGPEDSGTKDAPVVYAAAPGETPAISGGRRLELSWKAGADGIFEAPTPAGLAIDQLWINGQRQPMARFPNRVPGKNVFDRWDLSHGGKADPAEDALSRDRVARWKDPAGGYVHAMHPALWGDMHWRIKGKKADGGLDLEGGWQNNRPGPMHGKFRFVENVREELDAPGEWFHDAKAGVLYCLPEPGTDLKTAVVEVVRLAHLVELRGSREKPVQFVEFRGLAFRHAARTFMDNREPLLRSDWTVYRGGALVFEGAADCAATDCAFDQVGGNTVFVNRWNRRIAVRGCLIKESGANGVAFVGSPKAVRSPLFNYGQKFDYAALDRTPGPLTDDYPADCLVEDCLITRTGRDEKQTAPVQISMAQGITVRHCSIYEVPRAGINIGDGCWGGHLVEHCDIFDTVLETGDHGSFNSWGRDRYWHPGIAEGNRQVAADPKLPLLDMVKPNILRHNRWRCDHGWDVDLDDGSTNYEITDNLLLRGGLKLREGFRRTVVNNITVNNSLHPHCWYDESLDAVTGNIFMGAYRPAGGMPKGRWGKEVDRNLFAASDGDRTKFAANGCDANSAVGDPMFVDPARGDFRVKDGSPALKLGFRNFPMDTFGVRKPELRKIARTPEIPALKGAAPEAVPRRKEAGLQAWWQQAGIKNIEGEEFSAFGVSRDSGGVHLVDVPPGSIAARAGFRNDDLIQGVNGQPVRQIPDLVKLQNAAAGKPLTVGIVRQQQPQKVTVGNYVYVAAEASPEGSFKDLSPAPADRTVPIRAIATQPETHNEPLPTLYDGKLASDYGPVFGNGAYAGLYKADLGGARAVSEIGTWSFNQNGNRGPQSFALYGSQSEDDPGWNVGDRKAFTPIAEVDTAAAGAGKFHASSVRHSRGESLGSFRWLVWAAHPLNPAGEHSAYQEFQVFPPR